MIFSSTAATAIALLLASEAAAVSLSSFTPKLQGLTPSCQSVYTTEIAGCQRNEFGSRPQCSQACIDGLAQISQAVYRNCGNDRVPDNTIVGVFKLGQGIMALCKVEVKTIRGSAASTSATPVATSEEAEPTSTEESSSSRTEESASSTATPSSSLSSSPISTPASTPENTRPPIRLTDAPASQTPTSTSSSESANRTANSQKSNDDSGGGSPFDIQVGTASGLQRWSMLSMALAAVALGAMTL